MSKHVEPPQHACLYRYNIVAIELGPLPIDEIYRAFGISLNVGLVHFSVRAQQHARERHPDDFDLCLAHIERVIAAPDYVGRKPEQTDGFEMIGESDHAIVLVAIKMRSDSAGRYIVASTYLIDRNSLERRLRKGFVKPSKKWKSLAEARL